MPESLRILILEDNPTDAELVQFELQEANLVFTAKVVMTKKDFIRELDEFCPDLILSDYDLPSYNGALALAAAKQRYPDTPFILVTGAVSEDRAIEILTQGAKDYVLKNRLHQRLLPAVQRALAEAEEHRARKQAEAELRETHRTLEEKIKARTMELEAQITTRKKAEALLRESQERQRLVLQASSMGTFEVDMLTGDGQWNTKEYELLGLCPGDVPAVPDSFFRFVHPDDVGRLQDQWDEALRTGEFDAEFRIVRADGQERWLAGKGQFIFDGKPDEDEPGTKGKALRFMGVNFDISERKKADEEASKMLTAVSQEKERLEALINSIHDEIWFADTEKRFALANPTALMEFNLGPDNGLNVEEFAASLEVYRPDGSARPVEEAPPLRALKGEVVRNQEEIVRTPANGRLRYRQVSSNPVRGASGQIIGSVSVVRDITERRQSEAEIHALTERLSYHVEHSPLAVIEWGPDMRLIRWSGEAERTFGWRAEEVLGKRMEDFKWIYKEDESRVAEVRAELQSGANPRRFSANRNYRKDGTVIYCEWYNSSLVGSQGELLSILSLVLDVTERKQAEEALREIEERLRALITASSDVVYRMSPDWSEMRQLHGRNFIPDTEEPTHNWLQGYIPPEDESLVKSVIDKAIRNKSIFELEHRVLRMDGTIGWTYSRAIPIMDEDGEITEWFGAASDITERKEMEIIQTFLAQASVVHSDEPFFNALARYIGVSLCMDYVCIDRLEGDGLTASTVAVWNDGHFEDNVTYALKDTPCGAVVGKTVCCFPTAVCKLFPHDEALKDLKAESYVGVTLFGHTGKPVGLIAVIGRSPLKNRTLAENLLKMISTRAAGEIERLTAENTMKEQGQRLEEANKELESFSYSVSHDLRAPLRAIDGFSRKLEREYKDKVDEKFATTINVIRNNAKMMGNLIDDLLSFSKVQKTGMKITVIDMDQLANDVWHDILSANTKRDLKFLKINILPGYGDPALIRQVLFNFLSNAVKFTKDRKPAIIEMSSYSQSDKIVYCIKDNGTGFDMEYYDKLFGVFQRLHSHDEYEGTGIGLAIVQRIVKRHGGNVWATGEVDKGATFYFSLLSKLQN